MKKTFLLLFALVPFIALSQTFKNVNGVVNGQTLGVADNSSASAGYVGETVSSLVALGSAVALTSGTASNVTSISLTAGDWDVSGNVNFTESTASASARSGGINTTSATIPTDGSEVNLGSITSASTQKNSVTMATKRISISGTTTVYLVGKVSVDGGTVSAYGAIYARRVR